MKLDSLVIVDICPFLLRYGEHSLYVKPSLKMLKVQFEIDNLERHFRISLDVGYSLHNVYLAIKLLCLPVKSSYVPLTASNQQVSLN
jgi:hypothetical protein